MTKKILRSSQCAIIQAIREFCKKLEDAEKSQVEIRPSNSFKSDTSYSDLDKDKSKFIDITWKYRPGSANSKKNDYQARVRTFVHDTPKDDLLWYTKL